MYKTIFDYSQKELSQDAFLAWFFKLADLETREEFSKQFPWKGEKLANGIGECATAVLRLFTGIVDLEPKKVEIYKQWEKIDLWVSINDKYSLIIEDKTSTSEHDDQLSTYKEKALSWCKENSQFLICVYYKTESFTVKEKKNVEGKGYSVFERSDVLNVMSRYEDVIFQDDVLTSYYLFLKKKEDMENATFSIPHCRWDWYQYVGFFKELDQLFFERHNSYWDYVPNQTGGFCGFWWHFRRFENREFEVYLQFEYGKLVIKMGEVSEDKAEARTYVVNKLNEKAKAMNIEVQKPARYGCGVTMTVAIISKNEWCSETDDGRILLDETVKKLERLTELIDELAR